MSTVLIAAFAVFLASPLVGEKQVADDLIYDQVRRRLASDPDVKGALIEVEVKDGVVHLAGKVKTERGRLKAAKLAGKVKGVKKVISDLKLAPF